MSRLALEWKEWERVEVPPGEAEGLRWDLLALEPGLVDIQPPLGGGSWGFTPKNAVGLFPLPSGRLLSIQPKVPIANVLRMWDWVERGRALARPEPQAGSQAEGGVLEWVVDLLLDLAETRYQRGLYRAYLGEDIRMRRLSGRLNMAKHLQAPWRVDLPCHRRIHTADLEENQILVWTLHALSQLRTATPTRKERLLKLRRDLLGHARLVPFQADDCRNRIYNRLNQDYEGIHALCGFFLQHLAPMHRVGSQPLLSFRIRMPELFEAFVAKWLERRLPPNLEIQAKKLIDLNCGPPMVADMVLYRRGDPTPLAVLDAKYKDPAHPDASDVHQVRSYAEFLRCKEGFLVYPQALGIPLEYNSLGIRTRAVAFPLDGDLEPGGQGLLSVLKGIPQ